MNTSFWIIDSHLIFCEGIVQTLSKVKHFTVELVAHSQEALEAALATKTTAPDFIFIAIKMPAPGGPAMVEILAKKYPASKPIAFSFYTDRAHIEPMFKAGCYAYIDKAVLPGQLYEAIEDMINGCFVPDNVTMTDRETFYSVKQHKGLPYKKLTNRELQALRLFYEKLTYIEIGDKMNIKKDGVTYYHQQLNDKLRTDNNHDMFEVAKKLGLIE